MGSVRLPRWVLVLIGLISVVRLVAAARIPLTPDEAYYWTGSRHLDFAYTDHPPAVAWLIALTAPLGNAPGCVRLSFVLCEAGTALALGAAALALAVALYVPFLVADARHGWQNLAFTLQQRHDFHAASASAFGRTAALRFSVYVVLFWLVGYAVALRPRLSIVAWTALPFPTVLALLAPFDPVEAYWLLGPFASLCIGIGIAVARLSLVRRRALGIVAAIPAAATMAAVLFAALDAPVQAAALHALGNEAKGPLYNSVYMFRPLAEEVRSMTDARSAAAVTDRLEIAAELRYYAVPASMIGTAPQVSQWNRWYDPADALARRALIVTYAPLAHRYDFAGTSAGTFFMTWCDDPRPGAVRP